MNYRRQEVIGILLCVLALCVFLSFATYNPYETPSGLTPEVAQTNIMGLFGIYTSYYLMKFSFGWGTFFLPIIIGLAGFTLFTKKDWEQMTVKACDVNGTILSSTCVRFFKMLIQQQGVPGVALIWVPECL